MRYTISDFFELYKMCNEATVFIVKDYEDAVIRIRFVKDEIIIVADDVDENSLYLKRLSKKDLFLLLREAAIESMEFECDDLCYLLVRLNCERVNNFIFRIKQFELGGKTIKIYTSYFANVRKMPQDIVPISISQYPPKGYHGLELKCLAPTKTMFKLWKEGGKTAQWYTDYYYENVLKAVPDWDALLERIYKMSGGKDVALLCYEKPDDLCHRHILRGFLNKNGIECEEWQQ